MICVAILSIFVGLHPGHITSHQRAGARASYLMRITSAMESELERVRGLDALPPSGPFTNAELSLVPGARGERLMDRASEGLAKVRLRVVWQTPTQQQRRTEMVTLLPAAGGRAAKHSAPASDGSIKYEGQP